MGSAVRETVALATNSDGDATAYSAPVSGRVHTLIYTKVDFADGSTITVTTRDTGQAILAETGINASAVRAPRQATAATDGTASLYAGGGEPVEAYIIAQNEPIKIVVASGGDTKTGSIDVIVE